MTPVRFAQLACAALALSLLAAPVRAQSGGAPADTAALDRFLQGLADSTDVRYGRVGAPIDTNEFVIVRQEVAFEDSPVPLLIKSLDKMIVERRRAEGTWVLARVMMRGELTIPMPKFGRSFEFGVIYDDYQINPALPDSLFTGRQK